MPVQFLLLICGVILHGFGFSGWILTTHRQGVNLLLVPMIEQYVNP
jgi:hypothetical protein